MKDITLFYYKMILYNTIDHPNYLMTYEREYFSLRRRMPK